MNPRLATINITKEQRDWLESEAKRTGRTRAEVVRSLIREAMESKS
jgi:predicted DNA-binding protein